ncbi:MAG: WecB/TagA/CpsF family glycosyltransferase [Clostridia bacterium]|nr:WecB/TagA/CpsF family glycosyltransferase [Clostridia bacterium]
MQTDLFGLKIARSTLVETADELEKLLASGGFHQVVTLNPEILCRAVQETALADLIQKAAWVTADGVGIVWACKVKGEPVPERVTGIDLMLELLSRAAQKDWKVFFLGSAPGVAGEAAKRAELQYPGLKMVGTEHGYFKPEEEAALVQRIKAAQPDLLFVALGAPRQEFWIQQYQELLQIPLAMGVGGSLDVLSGRISRIPRWMQKLNLEWLGRIVRQPSRLKRNLVLVKFVWLVWKKYKLNRDSV